MNDDVLDGKIQSSESVPLFPTIYDETPVQNQTNPNNSCLSLLIVDDSSMTFIDQLTIALLYR